MHFDQPAATAVAAEVYRLPTTVTPERYEIRLVPDLKHFTFAGEETVTVTVHEAVRQIQLNALELEIDEASVERDGKSLKGKAELDSANERVRLDFDQPLEPGAWQLKLKFRGILNDKLHGFYRSQYKDEHGATHMLASTQFEATDARRAFPCWDEPALKAKFKVTLVIEPGLAAISNAALEHERVLADGLKEVSFKETIRMSTYLVAFIVGEFKATAAVNAAGTALRVVHVPGKEVLTPWALEIGAFSLNFFSDYYGIKYPGDKLDLIAIPDFASGAMENLGAITFRETALLIDNKTASRAELERVADVVSHENAHMWFGDLVTMKWWNGLWLNEAFATFMEMLAVDAWKPNWQRWTSFAISRAAAMTVDALNSTRPIEFTVHSPADAGGMFDVLTYEKGASVLRMLERYLGGEEFRKGISLYLQKHEYANAETSDLWDAIEESSAQPVRKLMDSWIFQPGFPIVSAALGADRRTLRLGQHRFLYLTGDKPNQQLWHVPVMVRVKTDKGVSTHKLILEQAEATLELPGKAEWVVVNEGGHGYYRVRYTAEMLAALTGSLSQLEPIERFALVNDTWASVVAGLTSLGDFLKMARLFRDEDDLNVWRALIGAFNYLDMVIDEPERPLLEADVRKLLAKAFERMGWSPRPGESELQSQLRGTMIATLGTLGNDPGIQHRARDLYNQYKSNPAAVDPNLVPALIAILAHVGGEAEYKEFKENFKAARNPQEEQRYLFALADFRRPELLRRTMQMTIDGEVRSQNAPYLMHDLLLNTVSRDGAWSFLQSNWETMIKQYPENSIPRMCEGIVGLVSHQAAVEQFFAGHEVKQGAKTMQQHLERLRVNVAFKKREGARLAAELKS